MTALPDALAELERRASDPSLKQRISDYLDGDVPRYFAERPVLYLARHVATPNFETLNFVRTTIALGMKAVIGQDAKDLFVPQNPLKKALGKLPVCLDDDIGQGSSRGDRCRKLTIINFNAANGRRLDTIRTFWNEPLVCFHNRLLRMFISNAVAVENDTAWIDAHHRGDTLAHYRDFLSLFLAHGILFEDYVLTDKNERRFISEIIRPAFAFVERKFGLRPLIVQLVPKLPDRPGFWISYPKQILDITRTVLP